MENKIYDLAVMMWTMVVLCDIIYMYHVFIKYIFMAYLGLKSVVNEFMD